MRFDIPHWKAMLCFLLFVSIEPGFPQHRPKALVITGSGNIPVPKANYPPWKHEFQNAKVMQILQTSVDIDTTTDLAKLNDQMLKTYDLVISNSLFLTPGNDQLTALERFISDGKSFMTLHCGMLSFLNWEKYEQLMGGVFIGGPSSEPATFKVYTENMEFWGYEYSFRKSEIHPVSKAVNDFTITDELYYFQPSTPEFHVIARAENHPVMWWHPLGKGRVMSLTLGHDLNAKANEGYQQLLVNGVRWLVGLPLIQAEDPKSTRRSSSGNLAFNSGNSVTVSSSENKSKMFAASNLVDEDSTTRWSSARSDTAWASIDLQKMYAVARVKLTWEASYATEYEIQTSSSGEKWQTVADIKDGNGQSDELIFKPVEARFIRVLAKKRAPGKWGYSLYEMEVFPK